ncbi:MAG: mechanosensitive ion channel family protein [Ignavibacteriales bacterium]|nr:mechanosensitive ion channel family protein [Ignavibacteriales bacterium]
MAIKAVLAILILVALFLVVKFMNRGYRYFRLKMLQKRHKWFKGFSLKDYELVSANKQLEIFFFASNILRLFLILLVVYLALPLVFYIFPWTEHLATDLLGFIINPLKKILFAVIEFLPDMFTIIVIAVVFRYILKGIKYLTSEIENESLKIPGFYPDWAQPTYNIVRILVIAFAIIVIFPYLPGSDSPVFQGVSVFLGFMFTLSSAGSLSNIIAGTVLTYMRAFQLGDRVKIGDTLGDIVEKTLLVTRVRTRHNEIITIPNSTIMNSNTINYSSEARNSGLIMKTTVTIGYDVPWKKVHEMLLEAAKRTDLILDEPKSFVLQTSLDDFYVSYELNVFTREANAQAKVYSDLHQNIQDSFNESGVEIMSPHYRAARDGNMTTVPVDYLSPNYIVPTFNVELKNKSKEGE